MDNNISVEILGKSYKVKCPPDRVQELRHAASHVDKEMRQIRDNGKIIGLERIAVITALNLAHQLLHAEQKENKDIDGMAERIADMQQRIEAALIQHEQLQLEE